MKEKFKILIIIYLFLFGGMIMAIVFTGKFDYNNLWNIANADFLYLAVPVLAIVMSEFLFRMNLKGLEKETDLNRRAGIYQTASLIRWAILEGAVFFILFTDLIPQIGLVIVFAYFLFIYPRFQQYQNVVAPQ